MEAVGELDSLILKGLLQARGGQEGTQESQWLLNKREN